MDATPSSGLDAERREGFSVEDVTGATVEILVRAFV